MKESTLKAELVNHAVYQTRQEAMTDIFFYIEGFYNRTRRHSTLSFLSPADFEAAFTKSVVLEKIPISCPLNLDEITFPRKVILSFTTGCEIQSETHVRYEFLYTVLGQ